MTLRSFYGQRNTVVRTENGKSETSRAVSDSLAKTFLGWETIGSGLRQKKQKQSAQHIRESKNATKKYFTKMKEETTNMHAIRVGGRDAKGGKKNAACARGVASPTGETKEGGKGPKKPPGVRRKVKSGKRRC